MLNKDFDLKGIDAPLISVVVPIFNVQDYLRECIDSILGQTYKNIEIILVDDGSNDDCPQICDEYKLKDERISVIHKENGGLSDARNKGLEFSTGEYICFIDSDDYIDCKFIEKLFKLVIENGSDIAICSYYKTSESSVCIDEQEKECVELYGGEEIISRIFLDNYLKYIVAWNKLYKKSLFKGISYPVGLIHEDEATTCQLFFSARKVVLTNSKLYFYRIRESSITNSTMSVHKLQAKLDALSIRRSFFKEKQLFEYYSKDILVYLKQISKNCYIAQTIDIQYMKKMEQEFRKIYISADKRAWNIKNKIIMFLTYINPRLYGRIKL